MEASRNQLAMPKNIPNVFNPKLIVAVVALVVVGGVFAFSHRSVPRFRFLEGHAMVTTVESTGVARPNLIRTYAWKQDFETARNGVAQELNELGYKRSRLSDGIDSWTNESGLVVEVENGCRSFIDDPKNRNQWVTITVGQDLEFGNYRFLQRMILNSYQKVNAQLTPKTYSSQ